ncbi:MAG: integrase core domain-containing protein, partial [Limnochordia bacterium]
FTERFWRSLKYEEVYIKEYRSPREARKDISEYIELYNYERPHQSLNNRTPAEVYLSTTAGPAPRAVTQIPSLRERE